MATTQDLIEKLHVAAAAGNLDEVRRLIINENISPDIKHDNCTPLHKAVANGRIGIMEFLLEKGADIHARNPTGDTPLHIAVLYAQIECVKFLAEKKASAIKENDNGKTPYTLACWGLKEVVSVLEILKYREEIYFQRRECSYQQKQAFILSAKNYLIYELHAAAAKGKLDEVQRLIIDEKISADARQCGDTPLHLAAISGHVEVIRLLLTRGANIHAQNRAGDTPLHLAAFYDKLEAVIFLVQNKASTLILNNRQETPFSLASRFKREEISDYLYPLEIQEHHDDCAQRIGVHGRTITVSVEETISITPPFFARTSSDSPQNADIKGSNTYCSNLGQTSSSPYKPRLPH